MAAPRIIPTSVLVGPPGRDGTNVLPTEQAMAEAVDGGGAFEEALASSTALLVADDDTDAAAAVDARAADQAAAPRASITQHRLNDTGGNEPGAFVCWTADDGYTSFVNYFALLATKGIRGTLFLTKNWVNHAGTEGTWNDTYITQAQVQAIVNAGHELGEHGLNHEDKPSYFAANGAAATQALTDSVISWIETTFGTTVTTSAYPAGVSTPRTREIQGRSVQYARGTKGAVAYRASDPYDVPGIDVLALSEAAIKAYILDAFNNESPVVFLTHGVAPAALAAFLTKIGNCIDYAAGLGIRQGTFHQMMSERTAYRGPSGSNVDSLGHAYFRSVKATRLVVQRDDGLFGRAWLDMDETAANPYFDADGGAAFEFRKPLRPVVALEVGQRRVFSDGVTYATTLPRKLTSATAQFDLADVGRTVTGAGIPGGTTIAAYVSGVEVTLSADTTADASGVTITVGRPNTSSLTVAGQAQFYSAVALHSDTGQAFVFRSLAAADLGSISPASWARAGAGGAMMWDTGTGGSTATVKAFRQNLIDHTAARKMAFCTAAPTDASIANGEGAIWFDTTTAAVKLKFKAKESGGTVRTGEVALA
jgi:peptidoglycan/xylan/chitin deacetylase (PgdA/CDA1 family)